MEPHVESFAFLAVRVRGDPVSCFRAERLLFKVRALDSTTTPAESHTARALVRDREYRDA